MRSRQPCSQRWTTGWQRQERLSFRLPVDYAGGANTEASARTVSVSLSVGETRALLQEVPQAYRTQINDVLLTALVQAFTPWTGSCTLLVELEGHGREEIFEDVDLSRTVGWFTTVFPVLLEVEGAGQSRGSVEVGQRATATHSKSRHWLWLVALSQR